MAETPTPQNPDQSSGYIDLSRQLMPGEVEVTEPASEEPSLLGAVEFGSGYAGVHRIPKEVLEPKLTRQEKGEDQRVLSTREAVEMGRDYGKTILDISRKEKQTTADRRFVDRVVDLGSRLMISGLESGKLKFPADFDRTEDFLRLARSVPSRSPNPVNRTSSFTDTLTRLTGSDAVVDRGDNLRLDPRAEDYAMAATKYLAMMIEAGDDPAGWQMSENEANTLGVIKEYRQRLDQPEHRAA